MCPVYTTVDRRDIPVEFLIVFCNVSIYVSIIMNNNSFCVWGVIYCKYVFVIILSSELYLNFDAIIFTNSLAGKEYSGKTNFLE